MDPGGCSEPGCQDKEGIESFWDRAALPPTDLDGYMGRCAGVQRRRVTCHNWRWDIDDVKGMSHCRYLGGWGHVNLSVLVYRRDVMTLKCYARGCLLFGLVMHPFRIL